jgi:transposase-like protein
LSRSPGNSLRRQPKTDRGKQRVEKILEAAAEVFLEIGYEAATTHAIAARANTAIGSLYQFFPDKLAIFHALEAKHMEWLQAINANLLTTEMAKLSLEVMTRKIVQTHAEYFEHPIPQIVYLQYFITPKIFQLFDEKFERELIQTFANLLRTRNSSLSVQKSELLAEVVHKCYNTLFLIALRSDSTHRQKLYQEIGDLLIAYLKPHVGDEALHKEVMKCPFCHSEHLSKNGHKDGKQRYLCKDCGKQFPEAYKPKGYSKEIRQKCLILHSQGMKFREIERQTGVSHNTVIDWVKQLNDRGK